MFFINIFPIKTVIRFLKRQEKQNSTMVDIDEKWRKR